MNSKAVKIAALICIACVAIQAIIWIGIAAVAPGKAAPTLPEDAGE